MPQEEIAIFAAGCFWGVQDEFDAVDGVIKTTVGYTGGRVKDPTYEEVCTGKTGHAEAVKIIFNPQKVSYPDLLDVFFSMHDPTQLNRQGPDVGSQYRSAIFYTSSEQERSAKQKMVELQKKSKGKIVTEISKASEFYPAEEYHQHYNEKNGRSCRL